MTCKLAHAEDSTRSLEAGARRLATACVRRARNRVGETQDALADHLGTSERSVRRAESGRHDLGLLEVALRYPQFANALAIELLAAAERMNSLSHSPANDTDPVRSALGGGKAR